MRRQSGFAWLQVGAVVGGAVAVGLALWFTYDLGHDAGRDQERTKWQEREIKQQKDYDTELARLRAEKDADATRFNTAIAAAAAQHQKEVADAKRKNDRFVADVRAGRVKLRDPGAITACPPGGGEPPAGPATAGAGDGKTGGELPIATAEFLFGLAAEADAVVEQLTYAQSVITAYYELCRTP